MNTHWKAAGQPEEESPACKVSAAMSCLAEHFCCLNNDSNIAYQRHWKHSLRMSGVFSTILKTKKCQLHLYYYSQS
jgi:hypothetical protein